MIMMPSCPYFILSTPLSLNMWTYFCRQLGFWAGKGENIRDLFCTTPKVLKLHGSPFWNILKILGEESTRGGPHPVHEGGGAPCPLGAPPASWAPWQASGAHLWLYEVFHPGKNHKQAFGTKHRCQEAEPGETNLGLWRSCSAGETSLREGEIVTIVITIDPLIGRGSISFNIFTSTISSRTLVHLLYLIFVLKPQIGTCGLLVVLITPCS